MTLDSALDEVTSAAAAAAADVDRSARFPSEAINALRRTGLLGLTVPTELGGWGEGPTAVARVISALARDCPSSGMILTMHYAALAVLAKAHADDVLREAAAGTHLSTLALSERATRSSFWISMSQLHQRADGMLEIAADKSFVTSAGPADSYVVSVATPGRDSELTSDLVLVRADEGAEVVDWWGGSGLRGNASAPMRFRCTLSDSARLVPSGQGLEAFIATIIPRFQLGAAAVSVGLCYGARDAISDHLHRARLEHLDQRLIDQPVVRHALGKLTVETLAADGMLTTVSGAMESSQPSLEQMLALKAHANESALTVTDQAMRLGGGAAYSGQTPLDRLFRDARAGVVMAPTPDAIYDMVGKARAGQPII